MNTIRNLFIGSCIFLLLYAIVVGMLALRYKQERTAHIAWKYDLGTSSDLVPDILDDGTIVASGGYAMHWVNPDGSLNKRMEDPDMLNAFTYIGGFGDLTLFVSYSDEQMQQMRWGANSYTMPGSDTDGWEDYEYDELTGQWYLPDQTNSGAGGETADIEGEPADEEVEEESLEADAAEEESESGTESVEDPNKFTLVQALDKNGEQVWTARMPVMGQADTIRFSDDRVYVAIGNSDIVALDAEGKLLWHKPFPVHNGYYWNVSEDNLLHFMTLQGEITCFDENGDELWKYPIAGQHSGAGYYGAGGGYYGDEFMPVYDNAGNLYFITPNDTLASIARDGSFRWIYTPPYRKQPSYNWFDGLFGSGGYNMLGWGSNFNRYPAVADDGSVYYVDNFGFLIALDGSGDQKWEYNVRGTAKCPAVGDDGTVYVGSNGGGVYALNAAGRLKWRNTGIKAIESGTRMSADGKVLVETYSHLYAFDP